MSAEFDDVLTNQPIVIDNVRSTHTRSSPIRACQRTDGDDRFRFHRDLGR